MRELTMREIRALYPSPQIASPRCRLGLGYCVGGAFILAAGVIHDPIKHRFPEATTLTYYLRYVNPRLTHKTAASLASKLVEANDKGKFEEAWDYLDQALSM